MRTSIIDIGRPSAAVGRTGSEAAAVDLRTEAAAVAEEARRSSLAAEEEREDRRSMEAGRPFQ